MPLRDAEPRLVIPPYHITASDATEQQIGQEKERNRALQSSPLFIREGKEREFGWQDWSD